MASRKLYQILASCLNAIENCRESGNDEWLRQHTETIESLVSNYMPSGSGFDNGTKLDFDASKGGEKLVFSTSYHHMDDGMYDGWTEHTVTVRPSLIFDFDMKISGRDRNEIKDYMAETFNYALSQTFESDSASGTYKLAA